MKCVDIGTIQAFLDGELDMGLAAEVSEHLDSCDACAGLLAEAEAEEAFVMPALARELDTLVPTQRLWAKINDHIETEKRERPWFKKLGVAAIALFARPSFAVAAAALLFVTIGTGFWLAGRTTTGEIAAAPQTASPRPAIEASTAFRPQAEPKAAEMPTRPEVVEHRASESARPRGIRAVYTTTGTSEPAARTAAYDPAERNYESTIESLSRSLKGQKEAVMGVPERIAFERDMALVNSTIDRMRAQVRKNPNDASARQVLYNSYQNKIDLLNSVSQKQELVASLR
ncbi:MAG: zf-HC2 domain-containing protein [Acidobacteria bacterium]|nr:zf-HC2 domain-containing protein [Acidobacteriota bacterium]